MNAWSRKRRWYQVTLEIHWWALNRPRLVWGWGRYREVWVGLSWCNGNSDPVWGIDVTIAVPAVLDRGQW